MLEAEIDHDNHPSERSLVAVQEARARLKHTLVIEEEFWRQKARVKWLSDKDKNTKFFHAVMTEKRSKSVIHRIRKTNGDWVIDESSICNEALSFFQELFTNKGGQSSNNMLDIIPKLITE